MAWIFLVLLYGVIKGVRDICKKLAMKKNSVMEVLVTYTFLSFLFVIPMAPKAGGLEPKYFIFIAIKAFCIFLAWICGFKSISKLPVSLYGILDLSRVLFATFLGIAVLGEKPALFQSLGLFFVCGGLILLRYKPPFLKKLFRWEETAKIEAENPVEIEAAKTDFFHSTTFYVILALLSCGLNAISGFLDKVLMKDMTSNQLQFWYMLFLVIYYIIYILITREKIHLSVFKNQWIWIMAIIFVIGDKALFIANGMEGSKITVMTLIKQSGCLVTILGGRLIFKEKNTNYRLFCAIVIIIGIVLGVQH